MNNDNILIIGGGNAGLCAAITAARKGQKVTIIERGDEYSRGGNTKYTRDIRYVHDEDDATTGPYSEEEFLKDLLDVTSGNTNFELAREVIKESRYVKKFMDENGVKWQKSISGTLHLSRTNAFFLGGGKALLNWYYKSAIKLGVRIIYNAKAVDIIMRDDSMAEGVVVELQNSKKEKITIKGKALIITSGGFESNVEWLKQYWGSKAENFIIRGTRYNDGMMLKKLIELGAEIVGDPKEFHAIGVDARSPKFDGGIVTRVDSIPFSIVVNKRGRRFYDEGEDIWPKRYAIWGKLIAEQEDSIAFSIFDSKVFKYFIPSLYDPIKVNSIEELSKKLSIDYKTLMETIEEYNSKINQYCNFNPYELDNCYSKVYPPKSHWALSIKDPPFYVYPLKPGITFTYMGVKIDKNGRVIKKNNKKFENIFAAGEIMAGNILTKGYLGGLGLTIGAIFGIKAGEHASEF